ncbi:MAG TPA: exo-alpha-sialidase [Candidatus Dormibacteraeota bacterium]|nr:exo-alpha-sialidase [Candidatus Dormibacteraeota bacterium]
MKKNQKGFAHLGLILLVVIVLAAIGFVGWRVLNKNKSAGSPKTTTSSSTARPKVSSVKVNKIDTSQLAFDQAGAPTDPIGDRRGPFYHDVYTATSTDGIHFTSTNNKIAEHASVPDAIKLSSGQLVFYAVDGAQRSSSGALMGVSDDGGKTWKLGSLQLSGGGQGGMADPQVVMADNGQLRIYYTTFPGGPPAPGQPPGGSGPNIIDSAVSSDGIHFTKEPGDRIARDQITDPDIVKIGNTWFMYLAQGPEQIYATSPAGNGSFTYQGVIRSGGSVSKTLAVGSGQYRQFYCNQNEIQSQTSTDGINWSGTATSLTNSGSGMICDPSPVQLGPSSWLMVYKLAN